MKVLVLGGDGMFGHAVCRSFARDFEVWATYRKDGTSWARFGKVAAERTIDGVDATQLRTVRACLKRVRPDAVVNCIGIVKQRDEARLAVPSITVNSLFPHLLADICQSVGARLVHISTDCVFSGRDGPYDEDAVPDPIDLYGRSKLLGELSREGCLTVRTSIIGWEVKGRAGLLEWFATQRGQTINGYVRAIYSGFSTAALADTIALVLTQAPQLHGVYQVASDPISKYDLLLRLRAALGWTDIDVEPDHKFECDRSLLASRFAHDAQRQPPAWDDMIAGLAREWPTYAEWRGLS